MNCSYLIAYTLYEISFFTLETSFVRKHEGKIPLGIHRPRSESNTNIDLKRLGYEGVEWIEILVQIKIPVNTRIYLRVF